MLKDTVLRLLQRMQDPVIVECGAHVGFDTERLLQAAPTSTYYAFEPDPRNTLVFRQRGLVRRVKLVEAAIAATNGTALLHQSSGHPPEPTSADTSRDWSYSSSIRAPKSVLRLHAWCRFPTTIEVSTRSLDSFVVEEGLSKIDLLWADIQGAERDLIAGGQVALRKTHFLFIEFSNEELYDGQATLSEIIGLLPKGWKMLDADRQFALFENESDATLARPQVLIGALSGAAHGDRRRRCRETWMADARRWNVDAVFLLGAADQVANPTRVDDMLLLPCPDAYPSLPQRTRWFCRWALEREDWDYLFKCDDDTYVSIERLLAAIDREHDYIGGEWMAGVGYGSGGAGYLLSRRAASIVASQLTAETGAEDQLVGQTLARHGVGLHIDARFVGIGNNELRPMRQNDVVTTHGVSADVFRRSHHDTGSPWRFRIAIPTCNRYAKSVLPVTLALLQRYWPAHPPVDVICYDVVPDETEFVTPVSVGWQSQLSWSGGLRAYLDEHNHDQTLLLMLDDYGLCGHPDRAGLCRAQHQILSQTGIGNIHLTWQPTDRKSRFRDGLLLLSSWPYSVNTQAALWRRDLLLEIVQAHATSSIEDFELAGSQWFNQERSTRYSNCQLEMPEPLNPSGFVDETDKSMWALPYHNLVRRGQVDRRHAAFLEAHQLSICFG